MPNCMSASRLKSSIVCPDTKAFVQCSGVKRTVGLRKLGSDGAFDFPCWLSLELKLSSDEDSLLLLLLALLLALLLFLVVCKGCTT